MLLALGEPRPPKPPRSRPTPAFALSRRRTLIGVFDLTVAPPPPVDFWFPATVRRVARLVAYSRRRSALVVGQEAPLGVPRARRVSVLARRRAPRVTFDQASQLFSRPARRPTIARRRRSVDSVFAPTDPPRAARRLRPSVSVRRLRAWVVPYPTVAPVVPAWVPQTVRRAERVLRVWVRRRPGTQVFAVTVTVVSPGKVVASVTTVNAVTPDVWPTFS